jgi:hypothetical protein
MQRGRESQASSQPGPTFLGMTDETQSIHGDNQAHMLAAADLLAGSGERSADRIHAATRAARVVAADETAWPACWRQARHAVELCQRAAEIAARRW